MVVICCGGRLYGIEPFGSAMFCALMDFATGGVLVVVSSATYVLCSYLFTFEVWRLYLAGAVFLLVAVRWFSGLKFRRLCSTPVKAAVSVSALVLEAGLSVLFRQPFTAALSGFVSLVFYYFARYVAAAAVKAFSSRLSVVDCASMCAVLFVLGLACSAASVDGFNMGLGILYFVLLVLGVIGVREVLAGGVALGFGLAFGFGTGAAVAFIVCAGAVAVFRAMPRPAVAIIGIGAFSAVATLFGTAAVTVGWNAVMLAAGALPLCVLPRRAVKAIAAYFDFAGSSRLAVRHYINRIKADAGNKMLALASVFDETARLMNAIDPPAPDFGALGDGLSEKICPYCRNRNICDRAAASEAFRSVAELAYAGKPLIAGMPQFFASKCARTPEVMNAASAITELAREREIEGRGDARAKAVVVERLRAIKDVLGELGEAQALPVGFDGSAEDRITFELNAANVECAETFVTRDGVTAVVRTADANEDVIRRAVSRCLKREYAVSAIERTQAAGWSVATLKTRPPFEAVYARAGVSKTGGVSGDSYVFERIGDKFLVALCDGMGAGETAGNGSGAAVELIECFYRAGFDSRSVLSGVNRFLKLPSGESYSAADVAVCDLDSATVDIIKLGSPPCYIKTADTVLRIEGSSLPIGVLDEMRPYTVTKKLYTGQMLILVTDGVSDCFDGDELPQFINGLAPLNPEKTATAILERALKASGGTPRDDMTVVAFRLFDVRKKKGKHNAEFGMRN